MVGIALIALLLLFLLPAAGLLLLPSKRRPDGVFYWIALSLGLLVCGLLLVAGVRIVSDDWSDGLRVLPCSCVAVPLVMIFGLLANTFWARGVARKLQEDMDEEERQEALRRLSRRLWWPLLLPNFLLLLLMLFGTTVRSAPQTVAPASSLPAPVPSTPQPNTYPAAAAPSWGNFPGTLRQVSARRRPDGKAEINLLLTLPEEAGSYLSCPDRFLDDGEVRYPCELESMTLTKGEAALCLTASPPPGELSFPLWLEVVLKGADGKVLEGKFLQSVRIPAR